MTQLPNPPQVSTAPQAEPDQTDLPDNVVYYGDKLMERIARTICLVVAWAAIVGPVVWLCYVESLRAMLLIIGGFVTVCLLILAVVNPKRLEIISVAAA